MIVFEGRVIAEDQPTFVTYELGPTHDGVESAKKLIDLAAEAKADAVKFQILDPDRLVADRGLMFEFDVLVDRESGRLERVAEPLYDILSRRALSHDEWREVKRHADSHGLAFFATVGFEDEIALVEELGCQSIKIASADVNHTPFLRAAARTGKVLQLDTGNATLGEVEAAVDVIRREGNENIIIHHCPSGYPARLEGVNLRVIQTLRALFPYPVAFSDHSAGWDMDIAAIALGASMVEKTLTLDRTTRAVEHVMSVEPPDHIRFVEIIRGVRTALGSTRRVMTEAELTKRKNVRRSLHLAQDAPAGAVLGDCAIEWRRPGHGLAPDGFDDIATMKLRHNLPAGHRVEWRDLET